ncbi:MAG: hypothetical protein K2X03_02075 [Bryobacteraceae bacterium]|nr:hypothetical protein [Bryobacteraceae bacterium]
MTRSDFIVLDENEPKDILAFELRARPRDMAVLLDVSGGTVNEGVRFAAAALLEIQREQDQLALLSFSDGKAKLWTPLTSNSLELAASVNRIFSERGGAMGRAEKTSRLIEAIRTAADTLAETPLDREPLVLVVTHNRDNSRGTVQKQNLLDRLLTHSIRVEAVIIPEEWISSRPGFGGMFGNPSLGVPSRGTSPPSRPAPEYLEDLHSVDSLAEKTGGQAVLLNYRNAQRANSPQATGRTWDVDRVADTINTELLTRIREQYSLAIRGASAAEPQFRRLEIRLTDEAKQRFPDAEVHARIGYYSAPVGGSKGQGGGRR